MINLTDCNIFVGGTQAKEVYVGSTKVWPLVDEVTMTFTFVPEMWYDIDIAGTTYYGGLSGTFFFRLPDGSRYPKSGYESFSVSNCYNSGTFGGNTYVYHGIPVGTELVIGRCFHEGQLLTTSTEAEYFISTQPYVGSKSDSRFSTMPKSVTINNDVVYYIHYKPQYTIIEYNIDAKVKARMPDRTGAYPYAKVTSPGYEFNLDTREVGEQFKVQLSTQFPGTYSVGTTLIFPYGYDVGVSMSHPGHTNNAVHTVDTYTRYGATSCVLETS